ncbi:MAG: rubrerythrin family protein [Burkholderiales bacterium]|nr:rubrerythrin family protein [Burkholderiales bacterium]
MKPSPTIRNIESAFAGESMAHIKYLYFARCCRAAGDIETANVFEETAAQEVLHAFGHLDLLYPAISPETCLEMAIEGETYEYAEMYPAFRRAAEEEGHVGAISEIDDQIVESRAHAERFQLTLQKAAKRFSALARVEERHAARYRETLDGLKGRTA